MWLRIRSEEGTKRYSVEPTDFVESLLKMLGAEQNCDPQQIRLHETPNSGKEYSSDPSRTLLEAGLCTENGQMIFMSVYGKISAVSPSQDEVDDYLDLQNGLINRKRDSNFCKHGDEGMCDYCSPIEPFDEKYLEENKIKHMSLHSYIKSLYSEIKNPQMKELPILDEPDYTVKRNCPSHAPYPDGLCTKCQPSAIVLQRQKFRIVDHIEFQHSYIVENFIGYWRSTGYQRFGYLYGKYVPYDEVPLGIKAEVHAIYEPPQDCSVDGFELLADPLLPAVDRMSEILGLQKVGMIYSDLTDDGTNTGKVLNKRNTDTFFVSGLETMFMAQMQLHNKSRCKHSSSGKFGSKFVTVIATGDENGGIALTEFQASNACMAMTDAGIIEASTDPSLVLVSECTNTKYVPEVFYKYKNEYNVQVQQAANPTFPVEYLLVRLTHGFPSNPSLLFSGVASFPTLNRPDMKKPALTDLKKYLETDLELFAKFANFEFLCYLLELSMISNDDFVCLLTAIKTKDNFMLEEFVASASWETLQSVLIDDEANMDNWNCPHCTFTNTSKSDNCELCNLPKNYQ